MLLSLSSGESFLNPKSEFTHYSEVITRNGESSFASCESDFVGTGLNGFSISSDVFSGSSSNEIRAGSTLAFGVLMKRHEKLVYRVAFNHARNPDCAMDITQNVFLKMHQNLHSYSGSGVFRAWLLRIARNETLNHLKKVTRRRELPIRDNIDREDTMEQDLLNREAREDINKAMESLTDLQREAIVLRFTQDLSLQETARIMKRSVTAVKSLQAGALVSLRRQFRSQGTGVNEIRY